MPFERELGWRSICRSGDCWRNGGDVEVLKEGFRQIERFGHRTVGSRCRGCRPLAPLSIKVFTGSHPHPHPQYLGDHCYRQLLCAELFLAQGEMTAAVMNLIRNG